jgi:hypothetical protein
MGVYARPIFKNIRKIWCFNLSIINYIINTTSPVQEYNIIENFNEELIDGKYFYGFVKTENLESFIREYHKDKNNKININELKGFI